MKYFLRIPTRLGLIHCLDQEAASCPGKLDLDVDDLDFAVLMKYKPWQCLN